MENAILFLDRSPENSERIVCVISHTIASSNWCARGTPAGQLDANLAAARGALDGAAAELERRWDVFQPLDQQTLGIVVEAVGLGLGRIVAFYHRSSTLHQIYEENRYLYRSMHE
jgi:hypothetical protein